MKVICPKKNMKWCCKCGHEKPHEQNPQCINDCEGEDEKLHIVGSCIVVIDKRK